MFVVTHAIICIIGGLVIARHNEICDKLVYLSRHAFTSASVCAKPLIHQSRTISEQEISQVSDKDKEMQGGALVQGLWDHQVDTIIGFKIGDADAYSYKYEPLAALLSWWGNYQKVQAR